MKLGNDAQLERATQWRFACRLCGWYALCCDVLADRDGKDKPLNWYMACQPCATKSGLPVSKASPRQLAHPDSQRPATETYLIP